MEAEKIVIQRYEGQDECNVYCRNFLEERNPNTCLSYVVVQLSRSELVDLLANIDEILDEWEKID